MACSQSKVWPRCRNGPYHEGRIVRRHSRQMGTGDRLRVGDYPEGYSSGIPADYWHGGASPPFDPSSVAPTAGPMVLGFDRDNGTRPGAGCGYGGGRTKCVASLGVGTRANYLTDRSAVEEQLPRLAQSEY